MYLYLHLLINSLPPPFLHSLPPPCTHSLSPSPLPLTLPIPQHGLLPGSTASVLVLAGSISPHSQDILFHLDIQLAELCRHVA